MLICWADLFRNGFIVRKTDEPQSTRAKSWAQLESNLPKGWQIEPVSVEVEKNDTVISNPLEVLNILIELSWIDKSLDEILDELQISQWTDSKGNSKWFQWDERISDEYDILYKFLHHYYYWKWAFIKRGNREIYWKVELSREKYRVQTSKGILVMPCVRVVPERGDIVYCFFPVKALLTNNEAWLVNVFNYDIVSENERDNIEKEILWLLAKLPMCTAKKNVIEANNIWEKVEQICREAWTIKSVNVANSVLSLNFDWRMATDTDEEYEPVALPPFTIKINLRNFSITGNAHKHPHALWGGDLCLWGTLTELVQKCITEKDILALVEWMIKFANCWTSSDAGHTDREPAECIKNWANDNAWYDNSGDSLPIDKEEIIKTLRMRTVSTTPTNNYEFNKFLYGNEE